MIFNILKGVSFIFMKRRFKRNKKECFVGGSVVEKAETLPTYLQGSKYKGLYFSGHLSLKGLYIVSSCGG